MYKMLNTQEFGAQIRIIREELNYTRKQVENLTGINKETLRKVERGDVVPKITTLQLLSVEYRVDLIQLFNTVKDNNLLLNTNNLVDDILLSHAGSTDSLDKYIIDPKDTKAYNLIDPNEINQFNSFIKYLPMSQHDDKELKLNAIKGLTEALKIKHDTFNLESITTYSYNYIELRILFVIGVIFAELDDFIKSSYIFATVHEHINIDSFSSLKSIQLYIKLLCNLSYNQHNLDNHVKTLEIANNGIEMCNKFNSSFLLEVLLYRKAVAQHELKDPAALNTFRQVRSILEIKGYDKQIEIYSKVTKRNYNIEF